MGEGSLSQDEIDALLQGADETAYDAGPIGGLAVEMNYLQLTKTYLLIFYRILSHLQEEIWKHCFPNQLSLQVPVWNPNHLGTSQMSWVRVL